DSSWWVLGSVAPDIQVPKPAALESIAPPVTLSGMSTAFEAVVNVELYQDNSLIPMAATTVMGGSMGMMGPFSGFFSFPKPTEHSGTLVFRTYSAKDGSVIEASSLRVAFAP
ncbi:MAG: Gmad2 immunoglobulin-like domain-containing protein, partial [Actinomycetota bacterium]